MQLTISSTLNHHHSQARYAYTSSWLTTCEFWGYKRKAVFCKMTHLCVKRGVGNTCYRSNVFTDTSESFFASSISARGVVFPNWALWWWGSWGTLKCCNFNTAERNSAFNQIVWKIAFWMRQTWVKCDLIFKMLDQVLSFSYMQKTTRAHSHAFQYLICPLAFESSVYCVTCKYNE